MVLEVQDAGGEHPEPASLKLQISTAKPMVTQAGMEVNADLAMLFGSIRILVVLRYSHLECR
jgi:hypothetical protein